MKRSNKPSPQATKIFDHVRELRTRFFVCLAALAITSFVAYFFYEPILAILRAPLNAPLYYSNPAGSFAFVMKICLMSAITVTIPVIIYNLIMFIRPAFEEAMPLGRIYITTAFSVIMAAVGAVFAYSCILPGSLRFFSGFQVSGLQAIISADDYLNFVTNIIITFVLVFQIPLLIVFIDRIKPILPRKMLKMEKWVVLGSLIIAAVVPFAFDLMTCLFIALPIIVLYNLSIVLVIAQHARIARKEHVIVKTSANTTIGKSEFSKEFMTDPSFSFDKVTSELISEKSRVNAISPNIARRNVMVMDIHRTHQRPAVAQRRPITTRPVAARPKVQQKTQTIAWNRPQHTAQISQVSCGLIISDIVRAPRVSRVLASF